MAKPCRYKLPGQDTWMSEDEFKKSLADGLLDKFAIDDKIAVRNFKPDATAAEKFRAPVTETAPQAEVTPTASNQFVMSEAQKKEYDKLSNNEKKVIDELINDENYERSIGATDNKGEVGLEDEINSYAISFDDAINKALNISEPKIKVSETNEKFTFGNDTYDIDKANEIISENELPTVDVPVDVLPKMSYSFISIDENTVKNADISKPVIIAKTKDGLLLIDGHHRVRKAINENKPIKAIVLNESQTNQIKTEKGKSQATTPTEAPTTQPTAETKTEAKPVTETKPTTEVEPIAEEGTKRNVKRVSLRLTEGEVKRIKNTPVFKKYFSDSQIANLKAGDNTLSMNNFAYGSISRMGIGELTDITKTAEVTKTETKPTTEKVETKGPVEVEAETKRGTKVTYKAEVSSDGKTATVQSTAEAPFGGEATNPKIPNLPIKTDSNGNRYVETSSETRVYIDKVKEAPESKTEAPKKEAETKRATVKILSSKPKLDDRGMPIITRFNQEVEFTKNNRTGKWETTDKSGNKIEASEDQAKRAEEAFKEQQKEDRNARERENRAKTREKIEKAFDSLKIDPKGKALSIPIPPGIYNAIIEGAKNLVLAGLDVTVAVKQAVDQVVKNAKAKNEITDKEANEIKDYVNYANNGEFIEKAKEAAEGQERVSGIKKSLTSEESQEIASDAIQKMTIKEALDAGQNAIESGEVVPDKLINSIINVKGRPLSAVETAAMVYYKANLDNDLASEYEKLNKALSLNDSISEADAKAEIARLQDKIAEYEVMANITGYQQGLSLRLRSMMLNSEYDLVKQKAKIKAQYGGKIPADVEKRLNELDKELREVNAKLSELEKKRNAAESEEVVKNIKDTKESSNKTSAVSKDGKIKIPTSEIKKAVLNGANTIDEVVDAVRDLVKKQFPNATDRQIRDAITNYGRSQSQSKDEIQKKIDEMKRVGRLLSKLEDVQNGIKKTKNKVKRDALTEKERELKEQIKEELSKIPLTDEEIADIQAEKLSNLKKRTEQSIRDFEKKISSGDFDKKKRSPLLELDAEAAKLKAKREEIKFKFDLEYEKAQERNKDWKQKFYEGLIRSISAPKGLIASLDFSAPFRQGAIFVLTQNPKKTLSQLGNQFKFWWSEKSYNEWLSGVKSSEYYPLMKASGLYIAEENAKLTAAEEAFMTNFMSKIPLFGKTKVFKSGKKLWGADIYGRAERAYTGFLNNLRVQAFLDVAEKMADSGISPKTNIDEYKSWADYVNNATGRGTGSKNKVGTAFEVSAPALSAVFFSPRFLWSRLNITGVNPSMYVRMSPTARKQAIKRTLGFFGAASTILGITAFLLSLDDDDDTKVELDPRSSDFAKIRIGNTRIDILAGTQQVYRTLAQAVVGEKKNIATGKLEELGKKYGGQTRGDVITTFFTNKLSPTASIGYKSLWLSEPEKEARKEEGEKEEDNDLKSMFIDLTVPLYLQDIKKLSKDHGAGMTTFLTLMSINGIGVQNITPKEPKIESDSSLMEEFGDEFKEDFDFQKEFEDEFKFD
jgi:hypothetical protein